LHRKVEPILKITRGVHTAVLRTNWHHYRGEHKPHETVLSMAHKILWWWDFLQLKNELRKMKLLKLRGHVPQSWRYQWSRKQYTDTNVTHKFKLFCNDMKIALNYDKHETVNTNKYQ